MAFPQPVNVVTSFQNASPPVRFLQTSRTLPDQSTTALHPLNTTESPCFPIPNPERVTENAYNDTLQETPVTAFETPCCPDPPPCPEQVFWSAKFKGCPVQYIDPPQATCEVNPYGNRYWVTDLNPLLYERGLISGAKWNPYQHMNARQMLAQFLWQDMKKIGANDPYTKPISNLNESFCINQATNGPPQYTRF